MLEFRIKTYRSGSFSVGFHEIYFGLAFPATVANEGS